ncbi:hypothetical protein [Dissulfurirhabdus thermomarina]|uniref:hypothetical protein n=1 Tax=Dissulfurirhabdus thermomarina TaxID=1765737 RepID=UPI002852F2AD|nr:hypothetical protein [Dissulfurirhabdus thermomarina]
MPSISATPGARSSASGPCRSRPRRAPEPLAAGRPLLEAVQPKTVGDDRLIALDTFEYLKGTGNVVAAVEQGLADMGYPTSTAWEWVTTDTFQMINHGVNPASDAADCSQCHGSGVLDLSTDSMLDAMGYRLKGPKEEVCNQCHDGSKNLPRTWDRIHNHITKGSTGIGCYFCHDVARPERGLCSPCDPCASEYVDNVPYPHVCPAPDY